MYINFVPEFHVLYWDVYNIFFILIVNHIRGISDDMVVRGTNDSLKIAQIEIKITNSDFVLQKVYMVKSPPPCKKQIDLNPIFKF